VLRKLLTIALACLVVMLIYFATVSADVLPRLIFGVFAAAIAIEGALRFRPERLILLKPCEAVGTVLRALPLGPETRHSHQVRIRCGRWKALNGNNHWERLPSPTRTANQSFIPMGRPHTEPTEAVFLDARGARRFTPDIEPLSTTIPSALSSTQWPEGHAALLRVWPNMVKLASKPER
jgi:hypothetical protein